MKPEDVTADRKRPFTGPEYKDVTTHPALRNSVRSIPWPAAHR
jgi:hypothetical protein